MNSNHTSPADLLQSGDLVTEAQAAKTLGVSPITLRNWRSRGKGPNFVRLQGSTAIRYRPVDLAAFAKLHVVQQQPAAPFIDLE